MMSNQLPEAPQLDTVNAPANVPLLIGIVPDDPISEAARKILRFQFDFMLAREAAVRTTNDHDAIHDMRVAVQRMRCAIQLFGGYYKKSTPLIAHRKLLKTIAAALGTVRDLQVFENGLKSYAQTLPEDQQNGLDDLRRELKSEVRHAERTLQKMLNGARYAAFVEDFRAFLGTSEVGARALDETQPNQVRHLLPSLVYNRYAAVRAYEPLLESASLNTLHNLRIQCKRLRYTLEFFSEVLGTEAKQAIDATKSIQDYLGQLQDARVSAELIESYTKQAGKRSAESPLSTYLASRQTVKTDLRNSLPAAWHTFTERKIRRALALSVAAV